MNQNYIKPEDFYDKSLDIIPVYQGCDYDCKINGCNQECLNAVGQIDKHKKYKLCTGIFNCSLSVWNYIHHVSASKLKIDNIVEISIYELLTNIDHKQANFGSPSAVTNDIEQEFFDFLFICLHSLK